MSQFKINNSIEKRTVEAGKIIIKYPDRIPIIVEINKASDEIKLDKYKYLVPYDLTIGQFLYVVRKRVNIASEKALFIFFSNTLPATSDTVGNIYKNKKDVDGFLYAIISLESTFG
jgi:GABA(A) receptor-associated protein